MSEEAARDWDTNGLLRPPKAVKASDQLVEHLRGLIVRLRLEPSTTLGSEADLVARTHLSRGTVREALRVLEAEGLVKITRGSKGGITVTRPDVDHLTKSVAMVLALTEAPLRDLMEFRKKVEPFAAALAAERASTAQREQLLETASHDWDPNFSNEVRFHVLIAEATNNQLFRVLLGVPNKLLQWHLPIEAFTDEEVTDAIRAHKAISRKIALGEPEEASRLMLKHIEGYEHVMDRHERLDMPIMPRSP